MLRSSLGTGILAVALCFQMLPFFFLMVVIEFALGVTGAGMLVTIPILFLALTIAVCGLASKRTRYAPVISPSPPRRGRNKPFNDPDVLIKTRAERYQDLKDILGRTWR